MIKTINDCPQSRMWDTRWWCDHVVCVWVIICSSHSNVLLLLSWHPPPSINPSLPQNIVYSTWITKNAPCVPNSIWSRNQLISCYSVLLRDVTTSSIISFSPEAQKEAGRIQFDGWYFSSSQSQFEFWAGSHVHYSGLMPDACRVVMTMTMLHRPPTPWGETMGAPAKFLNDSLTPWWLWAVIRTTSASGTQLPLAINSNIGQL